MNVVREWRDPAGNLTACVEEVVRIEDAESGCSSFSEDLTLPGRKEHRAWVYVPVGVVPSSYHDGFVFHCLDSLDRCVRFVEQHLPLASAAAPLSLEMKIARDEAMDWDGSLRPGVVERLEQRSIELFDRPDHHEICVLLTPEDLMPGYTFELFWTASRWRSSCSDLAVQLKFVQQFQAGDIETTRTGELRIYLRLAVESLSAYQLLRGADVPDAMRDYARRWAGYRQMAGDDELFATLDLLVAYQLSLLQEEEAE